jgi:uncharacterized protein with GYD domain
MIQNVHRWHGISPRNAAQIYLTPGEYDVIQIVETANSNNIAKYALANGSLGFVRSRTACAWPLEEATKIISELP